MVYLFGKEAESGKYNVLVEATREGIEILTDFGTDRIVNLSSQEHAWRLKDFESVVQRVLEGFPSDSKVLFTVEAATVINRFAVENRKRYANRPLAKCGRSDPALTPV